MAGAARRRAGSSTPGCAASSAELDREGLARVRPAGVDDRLATQVRVALGAAGDRLVAGRARAIERELRHELAVRQREDAVADAAELLADAGDHAVGVHAPGVA